MAGDRGRAGAHRGLAAAAGDQRSARFWWWVGSFAAIAVVVRVSAAALIPMQIPYFPLGGDGKVYVTNGAALARGEWFVDALVPAHPPEAMHPPLWTLALGGIQWAGATSTLSIQVVTAVLGALTVVLVAMLGRRVAGPTAGIWAGGLAVMYPGLWIYERNVNAEALLFPLLAAFLLCGYRFRDRPTWGSAALLGMLVGLLAMTRAEQAMLFVLVVVPLIALERQASLRRRLALGAVALGVTVAVALPRTIFNLSRFEQPVVLSAGSGTAMLVGACDGAFNGEQVGSYDAGCLLFSPGQIEPDDSIRNSMQRGEAVAYMTSHLDRLPAVLLAREARSFGVYAPAQQVERNIANLNAPPALGWAQIVTYWILLPLAIAGAVVLRRRRVPVYLLLAPALVVAFSALLAFGDSRYRAAMEVPLVVLAGVALAAIQAHVGSGSAPVPPPAATHET
jgi:4-amino-4-deoxy-L-arabinose transferase-like glycosyltransferase